MCVHMLWLQDALCVCVCGGGVVQPTAASLCIALDSWRCTLLYTHPVFYISQVQEMSNKAAARYDKVNSQHLAAKEMICVAESQLDACRAQQKELEEEPSSPSPLDLAWQEMLNHATSKVRWLVPGVSIPEIFQHT